MFGCFRPRSGAPVVRNGDSFFEAVSDQLQRVGVRKSSVTQLRANFVEYLRAEHQGGSQSGILSIRANEIANREEIFQRMAEFLQRDIYIIIKDGNFKHYRFTRLTRTIATGYSLAQERSKENRTIVLKLVENKYYQSMECYMAPRQLVEIDQDSRNLQVVSETLDSLTKAAAHCGSNQIIVVCVIGTYRSGKSTLLNELIKQDDGFSTSDGVETHTHGVWACLLERGDKCILYLDTEGTHDPRTQNLGCIRMLLWSLSVCSEFMYNYSSVVGEDIIKELFNLVHLQTLKIRSNTRPMLRILLRNFQFDLQGKSPSEYFLGILQSEGGDLSEEKRYLLKNVPHKQLKCYTFPTHPVVLLQQMGLQRSQLPRDIFAEHANVLENDLQRGNAYQAEDSFLSLKEWILSMQQFIIKINKNISSGNEGDFIDLSQCVHSINQQAFSEAFRQFQQAIVDYLYVEEFVNAEKESWSYFEENKVGNVDGLAKRWQDMVRNAIKVCATKDCEDTLRRMYTDKSLENYLYNNQKIWNLPLDKDHFIVKFYFNIYKTKIQIEKERCFDAAMEAVAREIKEEESEADSSEAEETESNPDTADEYEVLLSESDRFSAQNTTLQLNLDEFQRTQGQIHAGDIDDTDEERIEHQQNLRDLLNYISIQNVFESEACIQLIRDYSEWSPNRVITIHCLTEIMKSLNYMQKVGNSINVSAGVLGAAAGGFLLLNFFVPIIAPLFLIIGTVALSSITVVNALVKLGLTKKKAKEVTALMEVDHRMTVSFYQSVDRVIRESQGQPPHERIQPEVPVEEGGFATLRSLKATGDVAEIAMDVAGAGGVAIGRGVAVGLGAIGIVFDIGMVGFSIYDLAKGSKHKMSAKIAKIVAKLKRDSDIINNICYYTALHYIQLKLQ